MSERVSMLLPRPKPRPCSRATRLPGSDFGRAAGFTRDLDQAAALALGSIREPHWHANASELTYCVKGDLLVSVLDDADGFSSFTISAGRCSTWPAAALHHIENLGSGEAELIPAFSHERPEDFSMHAASER